METAVLDTSHFQCSQGRQGLTTTEKFREDRRISNDHHNCHSFAKCTPESHHSSGNDAWADCRKNDFDQSYFPGKAECKCCHFILCTCNANRFVTGRDNEWQQHDCQYNPGSENTLSGCHMKLCGKTFYQDSKSDKSKDHGRNSGNQVDKSQKDSGYFFWKIKIQKACAGNTENQSQDYCNERYV